MVPNIITEIKLRPNNSAAFFHALGSGLCLFSALASSWLQAGPLKNNQSSSLDELKYGFFDSRKSCDKIPAGVTPVVQTTMCSYCGCLILPPQIMCRFLIPRAQPRDLISNEAGQPSLKPTFCFNARTIRVTRQITKFFVSVEQAFT